MNQKFNTATLRNIIYTDEEILKYGCPLMDRAGIAPQKQPKGAKGGGIKEVKGHHKARLGDYFALNLS